MVPQSWILHCLRMYKIPDQVVQFIEKTMETLRRKELSRSKNPKRHIPGRCTITITICDSHDATQPHPLEMHSRIQTRLIAGKDQPLDVHGRHQTAKTKRIENPITGSENIQSR